VMSFIKWWFGFR